MSDHNNEWQTKQQKLTAFLERYKKSCFEHNFDYVLASTATPYDSLLTALPRQPEARRKDREFGRRAPAARSEVPSPGRWIRSGRNRPSGAARTTTRY